MEIPDEIKKLILEHIKIIAVEQHGPDCDHDDDDDSADWTQVARLGQEDILKRKTHLADLAKSRSDLEVLFSKLEMVKAIAISKKTEYWALIREKYCLPAKANIRIADDFRIMMKKEKADD